MAHNLSILKCQSKQPRHTGPLYTFRSLRRAANLRLYNQLGRRATLAPTLPSNFGALRTLAHINAASRLNFPRGSAAKLHARLLLWRTIGPRLHRNGMFQSGDGWFGLSIRKYLAFAMFDLFWIQVRFVRTSRWWLQGGWSLIKWGFYTSRRGMDRVLECDQKDGHSGVVCHKWPFLQPLFGILYYNQLTNNCYADTS